VWATNTTATRTYNTAIAPDGLQTATTITNVTGSQFGFAYTGTTSTTYTYSIWVKRRNGSGDIQLLDVNGTANVISVTSNWQRFSITSTSSSATIRCYLRAVVTGDAVDVWGAQLEAGAFATSYIPTVASQVTRSADVASMTGTNFSSWYNASAGTLYAQYSAVASGVRTITAINDGTANESIRLRTDGTNPLFTVTDNGSDVANIDAGTVATGVSYKFAGAYAVNNFATSINGNSAVTDTVGTIPTVNRMLLGNSSSSNYLNGTIKSIAYYPRRLSGIEMQIITS
jgi:hypothetical protein